MLEIRNSRSVRICLRDYSDVLRNLMDLITDVRHFPDLPDDIISGAIVALVLQEHDVGKHDEMWEQTIDAVEDLIDVAYADTEMADQSSALAAIVCERMAESEMHTEIDFLRLCDEVHNVLDHELRPGVRVEHYTFDPARLMLKVSIAKS